MTLEEFDATNWQAEMFGIYKDGNKYLIATVDFDERLIGLAGLTLGTDEPTIVRCENVTLADA